MSEETPLDSPAAPQSDSHPTWPVSDALKILATSTQLRPYCDRKGEYAAAACTAPSLGQSKTQHLPTIYGIVGIYDERVDRTFARFGSACEFFGVTGLHVLTVRKETLRLRRPLAIESGPKIHPECLAPLVNA